MTPAAAMRVSRGRGHPFPRLVSAGALDFRHLDDKSAILAYYRGLPRVSKPFPPDLSRVSMLLRLHGLGDAIVATDLGRAAEENGQSYGVNNVGNPHWEALCRFSSFSQPRPSPIAIDQSRCYLEHDCGPGHIIQRFRRAWGLPIEARPCGCLDLARRKTVKGRVIMHWEAGEAAKWQRQHIHPRARTLHEENWPVIAEWLRRHPELECIEIGHRPLGILGSRTAGTLRTANVVELIATAEYYIGICSGPMHVAAALGVKSVIIVNFPHASRIWLPSLVDTGTVEEEWFYPQNVHLHQESQGRLVPRLTADNLDRAIAGEIYPYWSDKYLDLIYERL